MTLKLGSMFSGYGGLDIAISEALGAETVFVADVCKFDKDGKPGHAEPHRAPCSILAHRFPDVPNLGDVSLIDWSPWRGLVDILCAGFPCQDVSVAGGRAGMRDGTRTGLWSQVVRAITELQPRLVVLENVPGIFTASASGDVEPCPICLGDGSGEHLRALDAVLADLAAIGFDADWTVVPASGVGAAHKRERWFCAAYPAGSEWGGVELAQDAERSGPQAPGAAGREVRHGGQIRPDRPTRGDGGGDLSDGLILLPTPAVNDMGEGKTVDRWDEWTADMQAKHGNGNGRGKSLAIEAQRLLPTPSAQEPGYTGPLVDKEGNPAEHAAQRTYDPATGRLVQTGLSQALSLLPKPRATDGTKGGPNQAGSSGDLMLPSAVQASRWGDYAAAIARWEAVMGRPAPEPTMTSSKGNPQLSSRFVEWMMGLPAGWVTDVPGVTRNEALKALGNGVVSQQAVAAVVELREMARWAA